LKFMPWTKANAFDMPAVRCLPMIIGLLTAPHPTAAQTWTPTSTPSQDWQAVASSADGSKLIAAGGPWIYCISTDAGSTWITNTQPQKGSEYGGWSFIASSADGTKLVGLLGNVIMVSTNSGNTWLSNNVPGVSFFASAALSADGNKLVVVDGNGSSPGLIYTSTNSGVTVTPTMAPTNHWISVASSADGIKLIAAATINSQGGGLIYASTNSGLTWTLTDAPTNNVWATVASSADGSKLVAASGFAFVPGLIYGGVYTSTNFGMTWTSNKVTAAQWQSVASSADGTRLVAVCIDLYNDPAGLIYSSTNSGATWVSNSVPNESWYSVASSADGNKLVAATLFPAPIYTLQTTPTPQLNLAPTNGNLAFSWIIPSTNFVLQQSADLTAWAVVTNPPILNLTNLQNQVTLCPSNSSSFYRLKTP
jgi:hypothetical protein